MPPMEGIKSSSRAVTHLLSDSYISPSSDVPRSIYEIEGARKCCIETNSFSKLASFTGVSVNAGEHGLASHGSTDVWRS